MKGWMTDIQGCRTFNDLPLNARYYIEMIEAVIEIPITYIGVGPSRADMIKR